MLTTEIKKNLLNNEYTEILADVYADECKISFQTKRYIETIENYEKIYGTDDVMICSAPGRSEICGNHTDHQHGEILAAAINLDAIAVVSKSDDGICKYRGCEEYGGGGPQGRRVGRRFYDAMP